MGCNIPKPDQKSILCTIVEALDGTDVLGCNRETSFVKLSSSAVYSIEIRGSSIAFTG